MRLRRLLRITGKSLLLVLSLVILYLISAFLLSRITVKKEVNSKEEVAIFILTNGVHTDLVVPSRSEQIDWPEFLQYPNEISTDSAYAYLAMGWGDKGFYLETPTWADLKASTAFKAAFGLSFFCHAYYLLQTNDRK